MGGRKLRRKCYKRKTQVSASYVRTMLYLIAINDELGVLELLGEKQERTTGYPD
jgi:hypothetical protein